MEPEGGHCQSVLRPQMFFFVHGPHIGTRRNLRIYKVNFQLKLAKISAIWGYFLKKKILGMGVNLKVILVHYSGSSLHYSGSGSPGFSYDCESYVQHGVFMNLHFNSTCNCTC